MEWFLYDLPVRVAEFFPSAVAELLHNTALRERGWLLMLNSGTVAVIGVLLLVLHFWRRVTIARLLSWGMACAVLAAWGTRALFGYAYDLPWGGVCLAADLGLLIFLFFKAGDALRPRHGMTERVLLGIAVTIILVVVATRAHGNALLSAPSKWTHLALVLGGLALGWRNLRTPGKIPGFVEGRRFTLFFVILLILPLAPYAFTPAPPDADVTSVAEITGYLFQGEWLGHVRSGLLNEWFPVRYPAGISGLAWIIGHALNMRTAEAFLIVWILAWIMFVGVNYALARALQADRVVAILFTLTSTVTGYYGIAGGQIQEMLAYTLGIGMILALLRGSLSTAAILLTAAFVTQPIPALPFGLVWSYCWLRSVVRRQWSPALLVGAALLLVCGFYLYRLGFDPTATPSQPNRLLHALTFVKFWKNLWFWLKSDSHGGFPLCLGIAWAWWRRRRQHSAHDFFSVIAVWFIGANAINGLFGNTAGFATFQAGFSIIALLGLGAALVAAELKIVLSARFRPIVLPAMVLVWAVCFFPGFPLAPVAVFTAHADIRMGRFIQEELPRQALVANIIPYEAKWGSRRLDLSFARGNCLRATVFARIADHQTGSGTTVSRGRLYAAYEQDNLPLLLTELQRMGCTHLWLLARSGSAATAKEIPLSLIKHIGDSYLYRF